MLSAEEVCDDAQHQTVKRIQRNSIIAAVSNRNKKECFIKLKGLKPRKHSEDHLGSNIQGNNLYWPVLHQLTHKLELSE